MSQYAAKQYTKWLSLLTGEFYRLPTEAEWEYACRAGTTTAYSFGDDPALLDEFAWYYDNAEDVTHDVGTKKPNPWGLYDMHGNASEWTLDAFDDGWYGKLAPGPAPRDRAVNWPTELYPRVLRGGSWNMDPPMLRSAARRASHDDDWRGYDPNSPQSPWWFASDESQDVGFRIVRPLEPPPRDEWPKYWDADLPAIQEVADHRIDNEGRGERGKVDPELPAAISSLKAGDGS
jgi:formylglycine-generating enzyme required for sulfatase activity